MLATNSSVILIDLDQENFLFYINGNFTNTALNLQSKLKSMSNRTTFAVLGVSETKSIFLAKQIAKTNTVLLFDQNTATLLEVYTEIISENPKANAEMMICPTNASWEADVILLSNDTATNAALLEKIKKVATGKIIITLGNEIEGISSASIFDELQHLFPFSKVVQSIGSSEDSDNSFVLKGNEGQTLRTVLAFFTAIGLKASFILQNTNFNKKSNE